MKNILMALLVMSSVSAFAAPTDFVLLSPKKITLKEDQTLELEIVLPCKNKEVLDFSQIVMSSDDSGDLAIVVGVVVSMNNCESSKYLKTFKLNANPKSYGYTVDQDVTFEPMSIKTK